MKFEYQTVLLEPLGVSHLGDLLTELGNEGWELIKIDPIMAEVWSNGEKENEYLQNYFAIFKRRAVEPNPTIAPVEYKVGHYEIDNSQPKNIQHTSKIQSILAEGFLSALFAEYMRNNTGDLKITLRLLKDQLWADTQAFGRSDKYLLVAEVSNDLEC